MNLKLVSTTKLHKKWFLKAMGLFFVLMLLVLPAAATTLASLEIASRERPYDSDNPVMSQVSPDFKLGKGILTTTYEISSYPGTGVSQLVGWGRIDGDTYIPYLYSKDRKATPTWGIVGQPYKEVNTFEITESPGDMLFRAWLNAPSVPDSFQSGQQGTQLPAKQKFTIEFQSADGSAISIQDGRKTAKDWKDEGNDLMKQGKYDEALEAFEKAIRLDPNYAKAWNNKGNALMKQGKYDEAIDAYDESISLDPEIASTWYNKGVVIFKQGKYSDAIDYFEIAIDKDPDFAEAWYNKGLSLERLGLTIEANKAYAKATELGHDV